MRRPSRVTRVAHDRFSDPARARGGAASSRRLRPRGVLPAEGALGYGMESDEALETVATLRVAPARSVSGTLTFPQSGGRDWPLGMALVSQECGVSGLASMALTRWLLTRATCTCFSTPATPSNKIDTFGPWPMRRCDRVSAMMEKAARADPSGIVTTARRDGLDGSSDGEKWFITGAAGAAFAIVVARTDRDANRVTLIPCSSSTPRTRDGTSSGRCP